MVGIAAGEAMAGPAPPAARLTAQAQSPMHETSDWNVDLGAKSRTGGRGCASQAHDAAQFEGSEDETD